MNSSVNATLSKLESRQHKMEAKPGLNSNLLRKIRRNIRKYKKLKEAEQNG